MTKKLNLTLLLFAISFTLLGLGNLAEAKSNGGGSGDAIYPIVPPVGGGSETHPIPPRSYDIRLVSPNGGEVLDRNIVQKIEWEVKKFPRALEEGFSAFPNIPVSIDLYKEEGDLRRLPCDKAWCPEGPSVIREYVKNIGTANLFDSVYVWKITPDIPDGKNYVVRISDGRLFGNNAQEKDIWWYPVNPVTWDESDGAFAIVGKMVAPPVNPLPPVVTPPFPGNPPEDLAKLIGILEQLIAELQKMILQLRQSPVVG